MYLFVAGVKPDRVLTKVMLFAMPEIEYGLPEIALTRHKG